MAGRRHCDCQGEMLCLVELRGFEPLTPCMPYTARPHECRCSEPSPLVKAESRLPPRYRCCPLLSSGSCPKHAPGAVASGLRCKRATGVGSLGTHHLTKE